MINTTGKIASLRMGSLLAGIELPMALPGYQTVGLELYLHTR
jgi:hypothetical protein